MSASKNPENTIIIKDNHIHITYYSSKIPYHFKIPKYKSEHHQMVLVIEKDGNLIEEDITHKHGIPYFLSAKDLGGSYISKRRFGEEIDKFREDEIPT